MNIAQKFTSLADNAKSYISLQLDNARLSAAEKLTVIVSTAIILILAFLLSLVALFFCIMGIILLLQQIGAPFWVYWIVGFIFVLLMIGVVMLKKPLIVNPTARFMSRLIVKDPNEN